MSILDTAVSGMLGNTNWLSTISQNVANSNTTGYKNVVTEFSALVDQTPGAPSQGAGVTTSSRSLNTLQGQIESTSTSTDLAVQGPGFFVVSNASGEIFLTRNGSFVSDASGNLVNAAGYYLMGASTVGATGPVNVNSVSDLQKVNIQGAAATAAPSTAAAMVANLPSNATAIPAGNLPSTNAPGATYTAQTTMVAYDDLGGAHTIDIYYANTGPDTWEIDAYDHSTATPGGTFPYSSGPLATGTLTYSPTSGDLTSGSPLLIPIPGGQTTTLDLSQTTQLATTFSVSSATINGTAPGSLSGITIAQDGTLSFQYTNGSTSNGYILPLANVASPDNLTSAQGDAYLPNFDSGPTQVGNANAGGLGSISSSSLEESTVDLATELTDMVQAQSAYEANSKVFQAGAKLLDVLNSLQA